jgi:hypothetical protein
MNLSAKCAFCFSNLKIQGTFKSSVSLFNRTGNKDLVSSVQGLNANIVLLSAIYFPQLELKCVKKIR